MIVGGGSGTRLVATKGQRRSGGRPPIYGQEVQSALVSVWRRFGYLCGKRLAPLIRDSVDAIRADQFLNAEQTVCDMLMRISPATIDRLLKSERSKLALKGNSYTRASGGLWELIPIRTFGDWAKVPPGHMQMDTVGNDGGFGTADCAFTLCLTDICLGWTKRRGLKNRAARWVVAALKEIRAKFPLLLISL